MKKHICIAIVFTLSFFGSASAGEFTLISKDLQGQLTESQILNDFGCNGKNTSPHLRWVNPPEGTKSFAVTVYDPDAPTGSGFWHWVIFNIPASVHELAPGTGSTGKGSAPAGSMQSVTSFGKPGFGGACPPEGDRPHRYIFTVYALDTEKLGLGSDTQPALVGFFLNTHAIQKASLISYYSR